MQKKNNNLNPSQLKIHSIIPVQLYPDRSNFSIIIICTDRSHRRFCRNSLWWTWKGVIPAWNPPAEPDHRARPPWFQRWDQRTLALYGSTVIAPKMRHHLRNPSCWKHLSVKPQHNQTSTTLSSEHTTQQKHASLCPHALLPSWM